MNPLIKELIQKYSNEMTNDIKKMIFKFHLELSNPKMNLRIQTQIEAKLVRQECQIPIKLNKSTVELQAYIKANQIIKEVVEVIEVPEIEVVDIDLYHHNIIEIGEYEGYQFCQIYRCRAEYCDKLIKKNVESVNLKSFQSYIYSSHLQQPLQKSVANIERSENLVTVCGGKKKFIKTTKTVKTIDGSIYQIDGRALDLFRKWMMNADDDESQIQKYMTKFKRSLNANYLDVVQTQFAKINAIATTTQNNAKQGFSTGFLDFDDLLDSLQAIMLNYLQSYGDFDQLNLDTLDLSFQIMRPTASTSKNIVKGGHQKIEMLCKYKLFSPESYTNCGYHCIQMAMLQNQNKNIENHNIAELSYKLKAVQFGHKNEGMNVDDFQDIANKYNVNFQIYDNLFYVKHRIIPDLKFKKRQGLNGLTGTSIKLQFRNGHCLLMNKREDGEISEIQDINEIQTSTPIKNLQFKSKAKDIQVWSFDIETYHSDNKGTQKAFCIGLCKNINLSTFEYEYEQFIGQNCVQEFLDHLAQIKIESEVYIYAHNGGKFDVTIINEYLLHDQQFEICFDKFLEIDGAIISQNFRNLQGVQFTFRDSMRLLAGSLEGLCKSFKPHYLKLSNLDFNWNDKPTLEFLQQPKRFESILTYLRHDCLSLIQIMVEFRTEISKDLDIDITDCFTSATLAKKLYFKKYYRSFHNNDKNRMIYDLPDTIDQYIRKSYFGGRCDIYQHGMFKNAYYYDYTSLYPSVCNQILPVGAPEFIEGSKITDQLIKTKKVFGFIRCLVKSPDNKHIALHGLKHENKLVFPNIKSDNLEMTLYTEEIIIGLSLGYQYKYLDGYKFQKGKALENIMVGGFKKKAQAKKDGKDVICKTWKIVINSAYGFWAIRYKNKKSIKLMNQQSFDKCLSENKVCSYNQIGTDSYFVSQQSDIDIKGKNIAIASAITSLARIQLYKFMQAVESVGHKVLYTDTDSIITTMRLRDYPQLQKKFQWDGNGDDLGSIKNELNDAVKSLKGGDDCFDECVILGPKMYGLTSKNMTVAKCKGVKTDNVCYEQLVDLYQNNKSLVSNQVSFVSGKQAYSREDNLKIIIKDIVKSIKIRDSQGCFKYNKGHILEDGSVEPLMM